MAVHESPDVDDDFFALVDAAFDRRRSCMGQEHDLSRTRELHQLWIDRRLMLKYVEPGARNVGSLNKPRKRVLVDHLTARRVHDVGLRPQDLETACRKQVISRRWVRAIDRD